MTLLEAVDVLRHAMPNLNLEQQQSMMQDIAACVNNVRNGIDKQTLASERWQKVSTHPDHLVPMTKEGHRILALQGVGCAHCKSLSSCGLHPACVCLLCRVPGVRVHASVSVFVLERIYNCHFRAGGRPVQTHGARNM